MVKKRVIITLVTVFSILALTGAVLSIIHGNRVKATAGITGGNENNENQNSADVELQGTESNQETNNNNQETGKRFGSGRDELYAKCNFTGTYVKDDSCALSKIPYYSADEILFGGKVLSCCLGYDTSRLENQNAGDASLYWLMEYFPNDEIRERADESRYIVYDTDDNCRIFLMFSPDSPRAIVVGYPILYKNELSYKDFSSIQPGDTMTKVSAIDDICEYYHKAWFEVAEINEHNFENCSFYATIHYLTDGLLKIGYGSLNADGDPVVNYVEFYPDYVMQTWNMKDLDYRIVPLDLQK